MTWSSATNTLMGSPGAPGPCGPCAAWSPFVVTPTSWHAYVARAPYGLPVRCPCHQKAGSGDALLLIRDVQMDHAIGPTASTVDDTRLIGVLVMEEVEIVSDQLHLVERLVQPHRRGRVNLLAHMNRRFSIRTKDVRVILTASSCAGQLAVEAQRVLGKP